jgi:hypothetical protein
MVTETSRSIKAKEPVETQDKNSFVLCFLAWLDVSKVVLAHEIQVIIIAIKTIQQAQLPWASYPSGISDSAYILVLAAKDDC